MENDQKFYKEQSKSNWYTTGQITLDHINTGSLQRIADAVEAMAVNHIRLQESYDYTKKCLERERNENQTLRKSNAAYKGIVKRNKKK